MTKVSLIVPVYNPKEEYLKECIDSLLSQTLDDIEIILIDNGSIDNNPKILKEYDKKYDKIKLIVLEKNKGFSHACNRGLKIATGEYIQIVDSDDYLENNACKKLYEKAKKYNSDLVVFASKMYDQQLENDVYTAFLSLDALSDKRTNKTFTIKNEYDALFLHTTLQDWNKFVSRNLIFDYDNYFCEDLPYILPDCVYSIKNLINAKNIIAEKEHLYNYRVNISTSIVRGYSKIDCSYIDAPIIFAREIDKIIKDLPETCKYIPVLINIVFFHIEQYFDLCHKKNIHKYYNLIRKYIKSIDKKIYTKELLKQIGRYKQFKTFLNNPYWLYKLKKVIYYKKLEPGKIRINIFGLNVYKEEYNHNCICKRYFGIFKTKKVDHCAIAEYIINRITYNLKEYIDAKFDELKRN